MGASKPRRHSFKDFFLHKSATESLGDNTSGERRRSSLTDLFHNNTNGAGGRRRSRRLSFKDLLSHNSPPSLSGNASSLPKGLSLRRSSSSSNCTQKHSEIFVDESSGRNALHSACQENHPLRTIRKLLCDFPDAAEKFDNDHKTPLHYAAESGAVPKVIGLLLTESPNSLLVKDSSGKTPLHLLCENSSKSGFCEYESVEKMVTLCPEILEVVDGSNQTPLHVAARTCSLEVVDYLIQQNSNTASVRDNDGRTPLHNFLFAMESRDANVDRTHYWIDNFKFEFCVLLSFCIAAPMSVIINDKNGKRPLEYAIMYGSHLSIIEELQEQTNSAVDQLDEAYIKRRSCRELSVLRRSSARIEEYSSNDTIISNDDGAEMIW